MTPASEATFSVGSRLWIYQRERFPLLRTAPLVLVFTAASITLSAELAGRSLPGWPTYLIAFVICLSFFFQLRVCDEIKDLDDDRLYRPQRPIPRGLVDLRLIVRIGLAAMPVAIVLVAWLDLRLLWLLALVWLWLGLMTAEFFVPRWLKARPFVYLVSHMLIMPLIDLFVTACEWLPNGGVPAAGVWLFLTLSFLNGTVLEIGRKLYAPENEVQGVETYSALLGPTRAVVLWCAVVVAACALLIAVGVAAGVPGIVGLVGLLGLAACLAAGWSYLRVPSPAGQARLDAVSGLWVLVCYSAAGFAPLVLRWS
jgi:hypothetical protein